MSTVSDGIKKDLVYRLQNDSQLRSIVKKIRAGDGDYTDAEKYASRAGQLLTEVFQKNITADNFPVGSVKDIASMIIPAMETNHDAVTQVTGLVQKSLNRAGNIGMNSIIPSFNKTEAYNLVGRMANYESFEDAEWMLGDPVQNAALKTTDDTLRSNTDFQYKSGLKPKIVRTCESDACEWCQMLEGEYDYEDVKDRNNPVYQRHNNCACEITYEPGDGRVQDVYSKQWYDKEAANERIAAAKAFEHRHNIEAGKKTTDRKDRFGNGGNNGSSSIPAVHTNAKDVTKIYYSDATPGKGTIDYSAGYNKKKYAEETDFCIFLHKTFGGDITCLEPFNKPNKKRSDYLWNNAFWELKTCSSAKAADSAVRTALLQIAPSPGGIMIKFSNDVNISDGIKEIDDRLGRSMNSFDNIDVMIVQNDKIVKVIRFSK